MEKHWEIMKKVSGREEGRGWKDRKALGEYKKVPGWEEGRGLESTVEEGFGSRVGWPDGRGAEGEGGGVERYVHNNYMCCT
jgi:hypothetical protein